MKLAFILLLFVGTALSASKKSDLKQNLIGLDAIYPHTKIRDHFIKGLITCRQLIQFADIFATPEFSDFYHVLEWNPEFMAVMDQLEEAGVDMNTVFTRLYNRFSKIPEMGAKGNCLGGVIADLMKFLDTNQLQVVTANYRKTSPDFDEFMSDLENAVTRIYSTDVMRSSKEYAKFKSVLMAKSGVDLDIIKKEYVLSFVKLLICKAAEMST